MRQGAISKSSSPRRSRWARLKSKPSAVLDKTGHETFVYSSAYAERNGKTGVQTFDVDDAGDVTFDVTAPLYAATKGDGQAYAKDGEAGLTFRFSGPPR